MTFLNKIKVANGGYDNAMTSAEYTSFFFTVSENVFAEAIDRFADHFIAPLLKKSTMQKEREAVDSEYRMALKNDLVLVANIYRSLMYASHRASHFDCGNLKTLKDDISDDELHAELLKFQKNKYVANKMLLAVQSKMSLDELQEMVVEKFSPIKSDDQQADDPPPKLEEIFKPEFYNKIYYMKPSTAKNVLYMVWALPPVKKYYKIGPMEFIANIFKNEGEGGLQNVLMQKQLITAFSFSTKMNSFYANSQYCMPQLTMHLTELGVDKIDEILEAVFSYLLMIKLSPIEELRRVYQDLQEKYRNSFRFRSRSSAFSNVNNLITPMMYYDDIDILRGAYIYQHFDEKVISDMIEALNQRSFNILISDTKHETYGKKEKNFGAEYEEKDFPEEYQKLWDERKVNPGFHLVKENTFKATDFEIFVNEEESPVS